MFSAHPVPAPVVKAQPDGRRSRHIDAQEPSFTYKIRESQDAWKLARQLKILTPLQAVDHKLEGTRFAAALGVRAPQVLTGPAPLPKLKVPSCASFTLKPLRGTSGKGVLLLNREKGGFRDILSGDFHSSWHGACDNAAAAVKYASPFYTEELVNEDVRGGTCPDDFKFYCFYGVAGLILQKRRLDHRQASYRWLDRSWRPVETGRYSKKIDAGLTTPRRKDELLAAAELLSSQVPAPFLRVDLYNGEQGPVFGEFTPHPGGFHTFSKEWDVVLGRLYEEAAARLQLDLLRQKFNLEQFWERIRAARA